MKMEFELEPTTQAPPAKEVTLIAYEAEEEEGEDEEGEGEEEEGEGEVVEWEGVLQTSSFSYMAEEGMLRETKVTHT